MLDVLINNALRLSSVPFAGGKDTTKFRVITQDDCCVLHKRLGMVLIFKYFEYFCRPIFKGSGVRVMPYYPNS